MKFLCLFLSFYLFSFEAIPASAFSRQAKDMNCQFMESERECPEPLADSNTVPDDNDPTVKVMEDMLLENPVILSHEIHSYACPSNYREGMPSAISISIWQPPNA